MCRGRGLGGFLAVTFVEAIDASCGINEFLFTREERVASRTDFDVQVTFLGGASLERFAARAGDGYLDVFGVNSRFHLTLCPCSKAAPLPQFQTRHDRGLSVRSSSLDMIQRCPELPLRNLCVLCASAVHLIFRPIHRRGAEDAEIAQRKTSNYDTTQYPGFRGFSRI